MEVPKARLKGVPEAGQDTGVGHFVLLPVVPPPLPGSDLLGQETRILP